MEAMVLILTDRSLPFPTIRSERRKSSVKCVPTGDPGGWGTPLTTGWTDSVRAPERCSLLFLLTAVLSAQAHHGAPTRSRQFRPERAQAVCNQRPTLHRSFAKPEFTNGLSIIIRMSAARWTC